MTNSAFRRLLLIKTPLVKTAVSEARASASVDLRGMSPDDLAAAFRELGRFREGFDAPRAAALFSRACILSTGFESRFGQLACGLVMARGAVAEMDTGEGKTLATAFASCLLALGGDGVHSVTVNPYLAARDHAFLSPLYEALGFTSALLRHGMTTQDRSSAYQSDIVHGSNAEFVFDRLRDGIALENGDIVQRGHAAAVVDEADSVLLDEASTPLVLSDGCGSVSDTAVFCDGLVAGLVEGADFEIDEEDGAAHLTPSGADRAETALRAAGHLARTSGLYDGRSDVVGHLDAAMKARLRLVADRDYIVRDGRIEIVDANTGRVLDGRRYADGLHEAVEIKEGVAHSGSGDTVSSTTYMNYFALYRILCGATGTAISSASEIERLYRLRTVRIPPHRPSVRIDGPDAVHASTEARDNAAVEEAVAMHLTGRPVLVATGSVAESVEIARLLGARGFSERTASEPSPLTYALLNASRAEHEAEVVSSAGRLNALTIATNMAGRGTDVVAGGTDAFERDMVLSLGGLHVVGVGRHASRRIDDQLRGRAGRRGEPGSTRFHVAVTDDLVARHASLPRGALQAMLESEGEDSVRPFIEQAQRVASALGADTRETLRQFSAVDTVQIEAFHALRRDFMSSADPLTAYEAFRSSAVTRAVSDFMPPGTYPETWDIPALKSALKAATGADYPVGEWAEEDGVDGEGVLARVLSALPAIATEPEKLRRTALSAFDECWREHVARLEILRRAVAFRTYALLQPLTEYRVESFPLFARLLDTLNDRVSAAVAWRRE